MILIIPKKVINSHMMDDLLHLQDQLALSRPANLTQMTQDL